MLNPYSHLLSLLPQNPLQVGEVVQTSASESQVLLPGGGMLTVRGTAPIGTNVFVRGGVIEAEAPSLTVVTISV